MLDTDTKRRIDTARDILVGKVPDPKSQVEQITIALIYKFMDDMDAESEELGGKRKFFTGEFARYGWAKLMAPSVGGHEMIGLYGEGISKMPENPGIPPLFRDIFKNAYLPYRDPETLKAFLKIIDEFTYDHSERLGDAFEYLLSVLGSQGDAGQFRTPRHIIDFIVEVLAPKKTDVILDPACGTAGFLISAYKYILRMNSELQITNDDKTKADKSDPSVIRNSQFVINHLTPDERGRLAKNFTGYDISPDMVRLSLVNLYLHGFTDPHIYEYDTLTSEERWNEFADVILANPPFMSPKGGIKPHKRFSIQAKRSEVLFVDYMAEHLTPTGRAGIIVPEGIIFQSQVAYTALRKMLVETSLVAVISLPAGVFQPYSGVKTSILILDKSLAKQAPTIAFFKVENDGFGLGAQRRAIEKNDLPQVQADLAAYLEALRCSSGVSGAPASDRAKGPTSYQPGATPQATVPSNKQGLKARSNRTASDGTGLQPSEMVGDHEPGALPQAGMECAVGASETSAKGATHTSAEGASETSAEGASDTSAGQRPGNDAADGLRANGPASSQPGATPQDMDPTESQGLKARFTTAQIVGKEKIAANGDYNLSGERYREGTASTTTHKLVPVGRFMRDGVKTVDPRSTPDELFELWSIPAFDAGQPELIRGGEIGSQKKVVAPGDVLLSRIIPHIRRAWVVRPNPDGRRQVASTEWIVFSSDEVVPGFLRQLLVSDFFHASFMQTITGVGGSLSRANPAAVGEIQIPLPPLEVQKEIVAEIEGYQKVINGARAVLDHYRPHIPIHPDWPTSTVDAVASLRTGTTPDTTRDDYYVGDVNFVKTSEINNCTINKSVTHISRQAVSDYGLTVFPKGTVLMAMYGQGKTRGQVAYLNVPACTTQNAAAITPKACVEPLYLYFYFLGQYDRLRKHGIDGHISHLNLTYLKTFEIPLPPLATQQAIVAEIEAEQALVAANRELITRFEQKIQATLARIWGEEAA